MIQRRDLLKFAGAIAATGLLEFRSVAVQAAALTVSPSAGGPAPSQDCLAKQTELTLESNASPFFTHYHQLSIPVIDFMKPPSQGVTLQTSAIDLGSYDTEEFKKLTASAGLDPKTLLTHSHDVFISAAVLERIANGEKEVEIRVISPSNNLVHTFLVTATPSTLVKVRRFRAGQIKA